MKISAFIFLLAIGGGELIPSLIAAPGRLLTAVMPDEPATWWRWLRVYVVLKLVSLPVVAFLWMRRRARTRVAAAPVASVHEEVSVPGGDAVPETPAASRVTLVPRLDTGRQMVVAARAGHTLELAFHRDPGRQHVRENVAFERAGPMS